MHQNKMWSLAERSLKKEWCIRDHGCAEGCHASIFDKILEGQMEKSERTREPRLKIDIF